MSAVAPKSRFKGSITWFWTVIGPFLGLLATIGLFAYLTRGSGTFLSVYNWRTISVQSVIVATAALGMTLIMIAGGIDLSVGSSVALVCVVCALATRGSEMRLPWFLGRVLVPLKPLPLGPSLLLGVLVGGLCGFLNGTMIARLRVVPFIITLGGMKMYRGLAKWLAGSTSIYMPQEAQTWWFNSALAMEPKPSWLIVAPGVWILLVLSLLLSILLRFTVFGRHLYAVGSNEKASSLCGLAVPRIKVGVYAIGGLLFGLAGVFQFIYLVGTGDPTTAEGLELQVIAAVVIGGASLSGGEGTILGTLIGCLIMSVLSNGCVLAGIPNAIRDIIIGAIIIAAVSLDRFRRGRQD